MSDEIRFLHELSLLLKKYNAEIQVKFPQCGGANPLIELSYTINNEDYTVIQDGITYQSIKDYINSISLNLFI